MKKEYWICLFLIITSVLLARWHSLVLAYSFFAVCKYVCSALAISYTTKVVLEIVHLPKIKNKVGKWICSFLTMILFLSYFILSVDTFLFHVLTWYPGILRYSLFNAYGIVYIVFVFPGLLWYLGSEETV